MMNREDYPSVTQLLPPAKFWVTPERLEQLRQEGNSRHELMQLYIDTGGNTFDDPFLIGLDKIFVANDWGDLVLCEKRLYSDTLQLKGKPDLVFEKMLPDLKSTFNKKRDALQLAGYLILVHENYPKLSISDISVIDKNCKLHKYTEKEIAEAIDRFKDCLDKYHCQRRIDYYFLAEKYKGDKNGNNNIN